MKVRSFRTRLIALVVLLVFFTVMVLEVASIGLMYRLRVEDVEIMLQDQTYIRAEAMDNALQRAEMSVQILHEQAEYGLQHRADILTDEKQQETYRQMLSGMCMNTVENTEGVIASYVYFDDRLPYSENTTFYVKNAEELNRTIAPVGTPEDVEVGVGDWYYTSVERGTAGWIDPFYYIPYHTKVISYTIPLYLNDTCVAVVGMDMELEYFRELTADVRLYDSGFGFLLSPEREVLYHPSHPEGMTYDAIPEAYLPTVDYIFDSSMDSNNGIWEIEGDRLWFTYTTLRNHMRMGTVVRELEVLKPVYAMVIRGFLVAIAVAFVAALLTIIVVRHMTRPLKELTLVAERMSRGDLSTPITFAGPDEFGQLASAFRVMKIKMQESMLNMSDLAYTDAMTGVNNKAAYKRDSEGIFETCRKNMEDFALVVVDVNNLKKVNDAYGHQAGDALIKGVATALVKVFGKRNTYRVGGDEFCILLRNCFSSKIDDDLMRLRNEIFVFSESHQQVFHEEVTAAAGYSFYNRDGDTSIEMLYQRADERMYANKHEIKEALKNKA
ncbi:MAG: diguanylate cyclase [Lachnospiraceae bacterium]|nr:diguanylate cyclase [Lachnospiraceae bacterium]